MRQVMIKRASDIRKMTAGSYAKITHQMATAIVRDCGAAPGLPKIGYLRQINLRTADMSASYELHNAAGSYEIMRFR